MNRYIMPMLMLLTSSIWCNNQDDDSATSDANQAGQPVTPPLPTDASTQPETVEINLNEGPCDNFRTGAPSVQTSRSANGATFDLFVDFCAPEDDLLQRTTARPLSDNRICIYNIETFQRAQNRLLARRTFPNQGHLTRNESENQRVDSFVNTLGAIDSTESREIFRILHDLFEMAGNQVQISRNLCGDDFPYEPELSPSGKYLTIFSYVVENIVEEPSTANIIGFWNTRLAPLLEDDNAMQISTIQLAIATAALLQLGGINEAPFEQEGLDLISSTRTLIEGNILPYLQNQNIDMSEFRRILSTPVRITGRTEEDHTQSARAIETQLDRELFGLLAVSQPLHPTARTQAILAFAILVRLNILEAARGRPIGNGNGRSNGQARTSSGYQNCNGGLTFSQSSPEEGVRNACNGWMLGVQQSNPDASRGRLLSQCYNYLCGPDGNWIRSRIGHNTVPNLEPIF